MALIKCVECGKELSSLATSCPHCGCPAKYNEQNSDCVQIETSCDVESTDKQGEVTENIVTEEKTEPSKKKPNVLQSVCVGILLFIIGGALLGLVVNPLISKNNSYTAAKDSMASGHYREAFFELNGIVDYKDAKSLARVCIQKLFDEKKYEDALDCIADNKNLLTGVKVKEEDYGGLCEYIEERILNAFSKNDAYLIKSETEVCYEIVNQSVLPKEYGDAKVYHEIGMLTGLAYTAYANSEEFFISVAAGLREVSMERYSQATIINRILESDSMLIHFLSGETEETRFKDASGVTICGWVALFSEVDMNLFVYYDKNNGSKIIRTYGNDRDEFFVHSDESAAYYRLLDGQYVLVYKGENPRSVPQFKITVVSANKIKVESCSTGAEAFLTKYDLENGTGYGW